MTSIRQIEEQIYELLRGYFAAMQRAEPFVPGESRVPLATPDSGSDEVIEVVRSLLSGQVTMNQRVSNKVAAFEDKWAAYLGVRNGIMTNSGSSANLLALSLIASAEVDADRRLLPGDEVITPAVTWTTTVSPIYHAGARPVFVDVRLDDLTIDPDQIESALSDRTKAIMPVHLLGNPSAMSAIMKIAREHRLWVIEDCCEAHGAESDGRKVGSFGDLSTFSFFFSHHLSTIEGGMVMTDHDELAEPLRAMRSQGVLRNMHDHDRYLANLYAADARFRELDTRYMFVTLGYNVRPTELNGGFGLSQVDKIDPIIDARRGTADFYRSALRRYDRYFHFVRERIGCRHVYFGFPLVIRDDAPFARSDFVEYLESHNIETRPIMTGLVTEHPAMRKYPYRQVGELPVARHIHQNGVFLGTHPSIGEPERSYVVQCIADYLERFERA